MKNIKSKTHPAFEDMSKKEKVISWIKWGGLLLSFVGLVVFVIISIVGLTDVSTTADRIGTNNLGYGLLVFGLLFLGFGIWVYLTKPDKNEYIVKIDDEKIAALYQEQAQAKLEKTMNDIVSVDTKQPEPITPEAKEVKPEDIKLKYEPKITPKPEILVHGTPVRDLHEHSLKKDEKGNYIIPKYSDNK